MNRFIYLTHGTYPFLEKLKSKHKEAALILMQKDHDAILLHETNQKTFFKSGSTFEVIASEGELTRGKLAVFHHFPLRDEGIPLFTNALSTKLTTFVSAPGALALRGLRPKRGDTFIVLTIWKEESDYSRWSTNTPHFPLAADEQSILRNPVYSTQYFIPNPTEQDRA